MEHYLFHGLLKEVQAASGGLLERLIRLTSHFSFSIHQNPDLYRLVQSVIFATPGKGPSYDTRRFERGMVEAVKKIYLDGLESGEVHPADPEDIAALVVGIIDFCFHLDFSNPQMKDTARPERILRMAYHGLCRNCRARGEKIVHER